MSRSPLRQHNRATYQQDVVVACRSTEGNADRVQVTTTDKDLNPLNKIRDTGCVPICVQYTHMGLQGSAPSTVGGLVNQHQRIERWLKRREGQASWEQRSKMRNMTAPRWLYRRTPGKAQRRRAILQGLLIRKIPPQEEQ